MSTTRPDVIAAAKDLAQDPSATPLLFDSVDYDRALEVALRVFDADVPNLRVVHHPVTAAAFRFVLLGPGALPELVGLDAWSDGRSQMRAVWHPYDTTDRGREPLDPNTWRVVREPGPLVALELLDRTPSAGVLRLELVSPHTVHASDAAQTSVLAADVEALQVLTAATILNLFAARALQNTGSTGLPSDIVDRRSQSDQARARARDLREIYAAMVGRRRAEDVAPASATRDLDVVMTHAFGPLWHPRGAR